LRSTSADYPGDSRQPASTTTSRHPSKTTDSAYRTSPLPRSSGAQQRLAVNRGHPEALSAVRGRSPEAASLPCTRGARRPSRATWLTGSRRPGLVRRDVARCNHPAGPWRGGPPAGRSARDQRCCRRWGVRIVQAESTEDPRSQGLFYLTGSLAVRICAWRHGAVSTSQTACAYWARFWSGADPAAAELTLVR
jgi:hypothetical protein